MSIKKHFKLYKAGKRWCVAAIATIAVVTGLTTLSSNASADTDTVDNNPTVSTQTASNNQVQTDNQTTNKSTKDTDNNLTGQAKVAANNSQQNQKNDQQTTDVNSQQQKTSQTVKLPTGQPGWQQQNNSWYYFNRDGSATTGWKQLGHWYYFDETNGQMQSGLTQANNGKYYYLNPKHDGTFGAMQSGWQRINGQWYGFGGPNDGAAYTGWQKINNNWYYFDQTGKAQTGWYQSTPANNWYYFDPTNAWALTGWQKINNRWYYFDSQNAWALTNWQRINNNWYYFDPENAWADTSWQKINNRWYYFDNQNAWALTNWQRINNRWYYFDSANAWAQSGWMKTQAGNWYYFDPENAWADTGWQRINNRWYYFDNQNAWALTNWQRINNRWYYFDPANAWAQSGWMKSNNRWYYFDPDNAWADTGWQDIDKSWYYFDNNGVMAANKTLTIDGQKYTFDQNGHITSGNQQPSSAYLVQDQRAQVARSIASAIANKGTVDYDWNNQQDNFAAFSMHDTAQLLALYEKNALEKQAGQKLIGNQGLEPDAKLIEENLAKNALITGKVQNIFTKSYKVINVNDISNYTSQITNDYLKQLKLNNVDGDTIGVGATYDPSTQQYVVTAVLFKKGPAVPKPAQATSTVPDATVTDVYSNNTTVNNPLTVGTKVNNAELSGALAGINNTILTGPKGEAIPQNILQLYFDALKGAEGTKTGLVGQKLYSNKYGNYHYVYWLEANEGNVKNDAWTVFMNNNKGVKYGDPIKVDVSATLTWGKPAAKPVSGIPTSKMTADQITTAYATGSDTGASHEAVKIEKINNFNNSAARGVDIGSLISLERAGVTFYDFKGQKADLFDVLQQAGVNYIRCRLWNDPYDATMQTYGGGASDEATLIQLAKRAKAHGMSLLMDFHYSDFWADPATQLIPKAWEGEDTTTMAQSVYDYTKKVLQDLKTTGVNVGMVQVGNEITRGILISQTNPLTGKMSSTTDGNYWTNEKTAATGCAYLSAGSRAVREVMPNAKIALHLEGANQGTYRAIMNAWKNHGVDYDILATSAYLFWLWSNKQYTVWDTINGCISMIKNEFGKKVIITETSWPFTDENSDGTNNSTSGAGNASYTVSPQGQVDAMRGFYNEISSNYRGTVLGSFWWEPAWIPAKAGWNYYQYNIDASGVYGCGWATEAARGYQTDDKLYWEGKSTWGGSSWDNQALFDDQGHPLQSLMMFHGFQNGYTSSDYDAQHNNKPTTPTEKATSTLTAKVSELYFGDNVSHDIKVQNPLTVGANLDMSKLLGDNTTKALTGVKGAKIGENGLDSILMSLNEGINTPEYTDAAGNKYHYQLWLDGATTADKQRDFSMTNQNKNYGDNLVVHYTATLLVG